MNKLRKFIRNWLGFSRSETNGVLILLPLMCVMILSEPLYRWWLKSSPQDFSKEEKYLDSLVAAIDSRDSSRVSEAVQRGVEIQKTFSLFDPNIISKDGLKRLGFPDNLSKRVVAYREKGGVFRVKRDLMKMYGMDSTFYNQLYPYIALPEVVERVKVSKPFSALSKKDVSQKSFVKFDLNAADTSELKSVYGIGIKLAMRIIKFRSALGGFTDQKQISEVYGLDSAVVTRISESSFIRDEFEPNKLNLNTAEIKTLEEHPYIKKQLAKAIMSYRFQHGGFKEINEIKKISTITAEHAEKLLPYLKVKD
jgi:competence protein ComEA